MLHGKVGDMVSDLGEVRIGWTELECPSSPKERFIVTGRITQMPHAGLEKQREFFNREERAKVVAALLFFWCEPAVLGAVVVIRLTCHPGRIAGFNVKNFPVFPSGIDVGSGDGQTHGIAQPASDSNDPSPDSDTEKTASVPASIPRTNLPVSTAHTQAVAP